MPIKPENTFAVVVALERYDLGGDWNKLRTIRDGIAFIRWLGEEKVLPENILFFAEPRDDEAKQALEGLKMLDRVAWAEAKTDEIKNALTNWLSRRVEAADGDCAFYFYWSGHGVTNGDGRHCLVCRETVETFPRVISLDAVQKALRMENLKKLRRQMFFIDACASPYGRGRLSPENLPDDDAMLARSVPQQFVACSAPPGYTAGNSGRDDEARFFSLLLGALKDAQREEQLPDMDYVAALLYHRYQSLGAEGRLENYPSPDLNLRGWNGRSFPKTTIPKEGESREVADRRRQAAELLLKQEIDHHELHDHFRRSSGREANPTASVVEMIYELSDLPDRQGVPRYWEWMIRIGSKLPSDHSINQWLKKTFIDAKLGLTRLNQLREQIKPPQPPYFLFVEIPTMLACRVRSRVFDSAGRLCCEPEYLPEIEPNLEAVREALREILRSRLMARYLTDLHIELFVPKELLMLDADLWDDPHNDDFTLGANYRVALRWIERANPAAELLKERWEGLTEAIFAACETCAPIRWTEKSESTRKFNFNDLKKTENLCFLTGFSYDPFEQQEINDPLLSKALDHGVPFALWLRERINDWETHKISLEQTVAARDRDRTPRDIQDFRHPDKLPLPRGVGVLWDDPQRSLTRWGDARAMFIDVR